MIVNITKEITYNDTDFDFKLRLDRLVSFLQEIAIDHSDMVGYDAKSLQDMGMAWVLNKLYLDISDYPKLGENISVITWSSGIAGVKAFREFVLKKDGEKITKASSMWTLLDISSKRIKRIPEYLVKAYETENFSATSFPVGKYKVGNSAETDENYLQTVRFSDFDTNMHMNNTAYVNILDTSFKRYLGKDITISEFFINFQKEVGFDVEKLNVGFGSGKTEIIYTINDNRYTYARGFVKV